MKIEHRQEHARARSDWLKRTRRRCVLTRQPRYGALLTNAGDAGQQIARVANADQRSGSRDRLSKSERPETGLLQSGADQTREGAMQRGQKRTLSQRFDDYQASKTVLFWACSASVIAALIVGFSWGGWVTGGTANEISEDSAAQARQELAAVVCIDRFMAAPDAGVQLTALREMTSPRAQGKFVEDGGWAVIVPASSPTDYKTRADHREAAGLCAEELAKREMPASGEEAGLTNDEAATAQ
jgi:hypothetical protein